MDSGSLKLVRTNFNYCVLVAGTAVIVLSSDPSLYAPITQQKVQRTFAIRKTCVKRTL